MTELYSLCGLNETVRTFLITLFGIWREKSIGPEEHYGAEAFIHLLSILLICQDPGEAEANPSNPTSESTHWAGRQSVAGLRQRQKRPVHIHTYGQFRVTS